MKTLEEVKKILKENEAILREKFKVKEIGIFGSFVRGEQKKRSDIDILVEFEEPIGWEVVDLHEYLEEILSMKVDLVSKGAAIRKPLLWESIKEDLINV
jgi:predicted nucleotidyltransferase